MKTINEYYDGIITAYPKETQDAYAVLISRMEQENCKFADKIIPTFLKPVFLSSDDVEMTQRVIHHVMNILEKVTRLYFSHPELRDYFYLDDISSALMEIDHGYKRNIVISRPDAFLIDGSLHFVEFNCDSPAGAGYCDTQQRILEETFPMKKLADVYELGAADRGQRLLNALIDSYKEFAGNAKAPNIAIVDWKEMRTQNEFRILQSLFKRQGFDTTVADPRDLSFKDGTLYHEDFPIDLVYRRAIFRELIEKYDEVTAFFEAYRKHKICVVNPLRSRLASVKAILGIITNQRDFKNFFTDEENAVIKKYIPWTRRVRDIETQWGNDTVSLREHITGHRANLVLKPADSYGGKDVVIGRESTQNDWEVLLNRIFTNKEDWVVQKYVDITTMRVPEMSDDGVVMTSKKYNLNPFVFNGEYAGCLARLSDQSVINVSAGGGLVPAISYMVKRS